MQTLVDSLTKFISEHTEFSQDVFVAILGVVIGSILTALINTRATRTQAKFNMEHELLKEYHKKCNSSVVILKKSKYHWHRSNGKQRNYPGKSMP